MDVLVNGESHCFEAEVLTVSELLAELNVQQQTGIAVALNYSVVPKSEWATEHVENGDEVEIVRATQGG